MSRIYFFLLLILFSTTSTALDLTLLYGHQDGGRLDHIDTDSRLNLGQSSTSGFILGRPISSYQDLELFYSQQQTELKEGNIAVPPEDLLTIDIHYIHLGGTVLSEPYDGIRGFLSGGLGMTHFSPSLSGASAEIRPSMSLGVGARWMPVESVAYVWRADFMARCLTVTPRYFAAAVVGCLFRGNYSPSSPFLPGWWCGLIDTPSMLLIRLQAHQFASILVGQQVDIAIGAATHITDSS